MLYSVLIYGKDADVEALGPAEEEAMIARHKVVQQQLAKDGKLGPVVRLVPTKAAATWRKAEQMVIDGPFAETKEQLLGFYVVDCQTREEALEAARQIGTACNSRSLEVRPIAWHQLTPPAG